MVGIDALDRRLVQRAGQVIDHRIQQRLHALVLEGASADHREDLQVDGGLANAGLQLGNGRRLAFEKLLQQHIVGLGDRLRSTAGGRLRPSSAARRESARSRTARPWSRRARRSAFISIRSTTPLKLASAPMGICSATGRAPRRLRMVSRTCSKSAPFLSILLTKQMRGTLYLSPCRHTVSVCGCTPLNRIEQRHRAVEHAQDALHLGGKVHVAGGVDDIDADSRSTCRWWRPR